MFAALRAGQFGPPRVILAVNPPHAAASSGFTNQDGAQPVTTYFEAGDDVWPSVSHVIGIARARRVPPNLRCRTRVPSEMSQLPANTDPALQDGAGAVIAQSRPASALPNTLVGLRRVSPVIVAAVLLSASVRATGAVVPDIQSWLRQSFEAAAVPGMVAVVTRADDVRVAVVFGDDGRGHPMSTESPLRVASLTKTVTAVAVHQLAERGRLRLDDPVGRHLPEFRLADPRYTRITVQQLLDNRSGIRDGRLDLARLNAAASLREYVAGMQDVTLATDPGTARSYCNANWEVLARMVEVVTATPYDRHLRTAIFTPLGMTHSTVDRAAADPPGGYQEVFGFHVPRADRVLFSASSGSNGLITTADDLLRWTRWLATGGQILRPDTRARLLARALRERTTDGFEAAGHRLGKSGMQMTEMSHILVDPARGTGAAVVVNTSDMHGTAFGVASGLLDLLEGLPTPPLGHTARWTNTAYAAASVLALGLALRGVGRARRWAARRKTLHPWRTLLRLSWLPLLTVPTACLPQIVAALTFGTRTITWWQTTYLLLTPLVALVSVAVAGLVVFAARLRECRLAARSGRL
jgi:CubicO group peptidase (beta-lactamase class C family)